MQAFYRKYSVSAKISVYVLYISSFRFGMFQSSAKSLSRNILHFLRKSLCFLKTPKIPKKSYFATGNLVTLEWVIQLHRSEWGKRLLCHVAPHAPSCPATQLAVGPMTHLSFHLDYFCQNDTMFEEVSLPIKVKAFEGQRHSISQGNSVSERLFYENFPACRQTRGKQFPLCHIWKRHVVVFRNCVKTGILKGPHGK